MRFIVSILIIALSFTANKLTAQNNKITATVINVTSDNGKVSFALYSKDTFMKKPIKGKIGAIKNGISEVVFENIVAGNYSVICYHDKNNNDKMDFQPNGMPMEDYGVSNNVINRFGPPVFEDTQFVVADKDVSLKIKF